MFRKAKREATGEEMKNLICCFRALIPGCRLTQFRGNY